VVVRGAAIDAELEGFRPAQVLSGCGLGIERCDPIVSLQQVGYWQEAIPFPIEAMRRGRAAAESVSFWAMKEAAQGRGDQAPRAHCNGRILSGERTGSWVRSSMIQGRPHVRGWAVGDAANDRAGL